MPIGELAKNQKLARRTTTIHATSTYAMDSLQIYFAHALKRQFPTKGAHLEVSPCFAKLFIVDWCQRAGIYAYSLTS